MNKICAVVFSVWIGTLLFFVNPLYAVDLDIQPRFQTGVMSYYFEQGAISKTVLTGRNDTSGFNHVEDEIEFSDIMSFAGGGATIFAGRWFLDLSGQYASNGEDRTGATSSMYNEEDEGNLDLSTFVTAAGAYDTQLNRADHAISIGYAASRRLSVYAGFKWAVIDLDAIFEGDISVYFINNFPVNGRIEKTIKTKFKYDGPFVGITYGWPLEGISIFKGMVSFNAGLAHLNSHLRQRQHIERRIDSWNGVPLDPVSDAHTVAAEIKGRTLGVTLGIGWRGMTPIKNLSYSLGISAYRYQFDSDNADAQDISESAVTFKVGVAYAF